MVADCVPMVLFDPAPACWPCVHAGWRGTVARVAAAPRSTPWPGWAADPARVLAGIGPAIPADRYQVGDDVADAARGGASATGRRSVLRPDGTGQWLFDLWRGQPAPARRRGRAGEPDRRRGPWAPARARRSSATGPSGPAGGSPPSPPALDRRRMASDLDACRRGVPLRGLRRRPRAHRRAHVPLLARRPRLHRGGDVPGRRPTGTTPPSTPRPGCCSCWPACRTTRPPRRPWSSCRRRRCHRPSAPSCATFYLDGLGEFAYRNGLDLSDLRIEAADARPRRPGATRGAGRPPAGRWSPSAAGIDSIVTVELVAAACADAALFVVDRPGDRFAAIERPAAVTGPAGGPGRAGDRPAGAAVRASSASSTATCRSTGIISAIARDRRGAGRPRRGRDVQRVVGVGRQRSTSTAGPINHQCSKSEAFETAFRGVLAERSATGRRVLLAAAAVHRAVDRPSGSPG